MSKKNKAPADCGGCPVYCRGCGLGPCLYVQKAKKTNRFVPAEVSCAVREQLDNNEVAGTIAVGGEKADIRVENTGNVKGIYSPETDFVLCRFKRRHCRDDRFSIPESDT